MANDNYVNVLLVKNQEGMTFAAEAPTEKHVCVDDLVILDDGSFGTVIIAEWFDLDSDKYKIVSETTYIRKVVKAYLLHADWKDDDDGCGNQS